MPSRTAGGKVRSGIGAGAVAVRIRKNTNADYKMLFITYKGTYHA